MLGIEAVGVVDAVGDGVDLPLGQKVATMMGGLGRTIDGSYAEYTVVDAANTIPFDTDLDWDVVGALPEMLQTAHGALTTGLHLQAGQQVLIHGGTSTVGLTAIAIAHHLGATVIATTRNPARADLLHHVGAGHVVIDDDSLPGTVRGIATEGLDAALEFVSAAALPDVLALTRSGGTVCFVGALSDEWTIPDFSPFTIPNGVHLTSYAGEAADLPADVSRSKIGSAGDLQAFGVSGGARVFVDQAAQDGFSVDPSAVEVSNGEVATVVLRCSVPPRQNGAIGAPACPLPTQLRYRS